MFGLLTPINRALLVSPTVGPSQETSGDFHPADVQNARRKSPHGDLPETPAICFRDGRAQLLVAAGLITNFSRGPLPPKVMKIFILMVRLPNPTKRSLSAFPSTNNSRNP
jgi:hypothetical protein